MTSAEGGAQAESATSLFFRLARIQFLPVMVAPILLGASVAYAAKGTLNPFFLGLVLLGSVCLHIAANSIDDVYDSINGVDGVAEKMFPKDFPGWKPIPRGLMTVGYGMRLSLLFYGISLAIGLYLSLVVGWLALGIAVPGILLSYFYVAPPVKLDYRGRGLGELAILLSFGPIPALGACYVLTGGLSPTAAVLAVSTGLLTVNVLLTHDMIFYDAYKQAGKRSLTVILGRVTAAKLVAVLGAVAYAVVGLEVAIGAAPLSSLLVLAALPLFIAATPRGGALPPPAYGPKTEKAFLHSVSFTLLLAAGLTLAALLGR